MKKVDKKLDTALASPLMQDVITRLNQEGMAIEDLIVFYGSLGYLIGASIAQFELNDTIPNLQELELHYRTQPTVDVGFMLQGLLISSWVEDFRKQPALSKFYWDNRKKKESSDE